MILPKEGNLATLRIVQALLESLSFSEEEHARIKLEETESGYKWDPSVEQASEVEIGPKAFVVIQDTLKRLDSEKKLIADLLPLWDKFCPEKET